MNAWAMKFSCFTNTVAVPLWYEFFGCIILVVNIASENISILDIGCTVRPPLSASARFTNSVRGLFLLKKMLWGCFLITILISYIKCLQLCISALQYVSCDVNFVVVLLVSYNNRCIIIGYLLT